MCIGSWKALEDLHDILKIRAIGVSLIAFNLLRCGLSAQSFVSMGYSELVVSKRLVDVICFYHGVKILPGQASSMRLGSLQEHCLE